MRPALFLDRDGVINVDHGYVHRPEEFEFVPGIFELVRKANLLGFYVVVVTNQAGIGRGYYSEEQFQELTGWMKDRFKDKNTYIDRVYYCPFHPEYGVGDYRRESSCRKPGPGMLIQAQEDMDIDMSRSLLIGDKPSDMIAGRTAGVAKLLYFSVEENPTDCVVITKLCDALPYLEAYLS